MSCRGVPKTWQRRHHRRPSTQPSRRGHRRQSGHEGRGARIADPANILAVAAKLIVDHPSLNVLINNAGVMQPDAAAGHIDDTSMASTIATDLMGPIRMTSALIEHLKEQRDPVVTYTTSVLDCVPLAVTAAYSATKAALYSYILLSFRSASCWPMQRSGSWRSRRPGFVPNS
jgi:short-subunit dehydrogenase involved in D-alanine esterification of teichoic acids